MTTPIERIANRQIGTVEFISPADVKVNLDVEAPHSIAMGTGHPQLFPRLNGFLLIPCESGFIVGRISWLSIEPSTYPKRKGVKDFGIVDLPFPSRNLKLNMLGILQTKYEEVSQEKEKKSQEEASQIKYEFKRGVYSFPVLGDPVLLPDRSQLRSIIESGTDGLVKIGTCPLADDADVKINPDRLFGRHLAVLGNTGSGKSCTVSGLIKWSLEVAQKEIKPQADKKNSSIPVTPNARFIILDPNGEYSRVFKKFKPTVFKVSPENSTTKSQLQAPSGFWNTYEWASITQASDKIQKPLLNRALREIKNYIDSTDDYHKKILLKKKLSSNITHLKTCVQNQSINTDATKIGNQLEAYISNLEESKSDFPDWSTHLQGIISKIKEVTQKRFNSFEKEGKKIEHYKPFHDEEVNEIIKSLKDFLDKECGEIPQFNVDENTPTVSFEETKLIDHLEQLGHQEHVSQHIDSLVMRIKAIFSNTRMKKVIENNIDLSKWLDAYIGKDDKAHIAIIDLSLVSKDIVYLVTAVIARMIFEALQRYKEKNQKSLPTVLVMEEAHTFIKKYKQDAEDFTTSRLCTEIFERIAREGRKFGLGLVLSSQRPSELSATVLSQCNTFLLHRITNDRDQEIVSKLLPDSLKNMTEELPVLPFRHAYLLGWASEIPILTQISHLDKEFRPQSEDPEFWKVWTREEEREINWKDIAKKWQNLKNT